MDPSPVGVNGNLSIDCCAAVGTGTLLPRHRGMGLSGIGADLLGGNRGDQGENGERQHVANTYDLEVSAIR